MRRATLGLLFVACALSSSFLTYMVVSGYWYKLGITVPGLPSLAITDVVFPVGNTSYFKMTVMNPSYSLKSVEIKGIYVITPEEELSTVGNVSPAIPRSLGAGESITFTCLWDWANYTGRELRIIVVVEGGSGATYVASPPAVMLALSASFNASRPFWFLLNITNSPESPVAVNLTGVDLVLENGTVVEGLATKPGLSEKKPYGLEPNSTLTLNCTWRWLEYRDKPLTVVVRSAEGYRGYGHFRTPPPVVLRITEVVFSSDGGTYYFNVTVLNSPRSPAPARICDMTVVVNNTVFGPPDLNITPSLSPPVLLQPNSSLTLMCRWNWTRYQGYTMNITLRTVLGYTASASVSISPGSHRPSGALRPSASPLRYVSGHPGEALHYALFGLGYEGQPYVAPAHLAEVATRDGHHRGIGYEAVAEDLIV